MDGIVGIDPGRQGGLAFLGPSVNAGYVMPTTKDNCVDSKGIADLLLHHSPDIIIIEKVWGMPHHSSKGNFTFGCNYGMLLGVIDSLEIERKLVAPVTWKNKWIKSKEDAISFSQANYPEINLTPGRKRKPHDGIADAVCIAHYYKEKL